MKLKVTCSPFQSSRDGRWYVVVEHGQVIEHLQLLDGTEPEKHAAEMIARLFGMRTSVAARAVANPGTYATFDPAKAQPAQPNHRVLDAHRKAVQG